MERVLFEKMVELVGIIEDCRGMCGLQVGIQTFGYALFFIKEEALEHLNTSKGWEIGVGPTLMVVDTGFARVLTSTTAKDDIKLERDASNVRLDLGILVVVAFVGKIHADKPSHQDGNIKLSDNRLEIGEGACDRLNGREVAIAYCGNGDIAVIQQF